MAACQDYAGQLSKTENFTIHFSSTVEQANYNAKIAGATFAIVQEAINNVKRHAHANNIWLSLEVKDSRFVITIRDDGQGFNANKIDDMLEKHVAYGLLNMRERATLIMAELRIKSSTQTSKQGTMVQLILPWPPTDANNALG